MPISERILPYLPGLRRYARALTGAQASGDAYVAARVLNLVVVLDREWRGEIFNRLEQVGRYHPSRTIFCRRCQSGAAASRSGVTASESTSASAVGCRKAAS